MTHTELSAMIENSNDIAFLKEISEKLIAAIGEKIKQKKAEARKTNRPRGRPYVFEQKSAITNALEKIKTGDIKNKLSNRHVLQLVQKGYVEPYAVLDTTKNRTKKAYRLSKKGKHHLTINMSVKNAEQVEENITT